MKINSHFRWQAKSYVPVVAVMAAVFRYNLQGCISTLDFPLNSLGQGLLNPRSFLFRDFFCLEKVTCLVLIFADIHLSRQTLYPETCLLPYSVPQSFTLSLSHVIEIRGRPPLSNNENSFLTPYWKPQTYMRSGKQCII